MGDFTIKINTEEVNRGLDLLVSEMGKDNKESVKVNAGMLLKKIAYGTPRSASRTYDSGKDAVVKIYNQGRARAGWYVSWKELGLPGMAYSTPAAVKRFASKEGTFDNHLNEDKNPHVSMINTVPYMQEIKGYDPVAEINDAVAKQAKAMLKYVERKIKDRHRSIFG